MTAGQEAGVTPRRPAPEACPGATAKSPWTVGAAQQLGGAWTALGLDPETMCSTPGPAVTTLPLPLGGPAAPGVLMRTAAEEGAGAGPMATTLRATQNTSQDRNLELEGTTATM